MSQTAQRTCYRHPDRVTGLSCSECGRPICTECMTMAPVGIRCPDHSGRAQGVARVTHGARRVAYEGRGYVTKGLIAVNVGVYLAELLQGAGVNGVNGSIYQKGALFGPLVAQGYWWRLITAAFLHYGPFHLLLNMLALWWFGTALEARLGAGRYLLLYIVSGLAGSAGALLLDPLVPTVGASGAIFGILGAGFVLERQRDYVFGGSALGIIVINLVFTLTFPSISIGGHIGGLIGGALAMLGMTRFGRANAAYGNPGLAGTLAVVMVGVVSILIAYFKVRGYAT